MNEKEELKQAIKDLIKQLHAGKKPEEMKEKFKNVLKDIGPTEIARAEEELIKEGMPQEEVRKLCDVHLAVFREPLEKQKIEVSSGSGRVFHAVTPRRELIRRR